MGLLDGETMELSNLSMITLLDLNFILYINPEFKPPPKSINFGSQPVKIEEQASSAESGKVRISPPYNNDPCLIAGQIVDISVIQASSLDGSQSTQPIIETGVTMSPDELDSQEEEDGDVENETTPASIPSPGY